MLSNIEFQIATCTTPSLSRRLTVFSKATLDCHSVYSTHRSLPLYLGYHEPLFPITTLMMHVDTGCHYLKSEPIRYQCYLNKAPVNPV
jgi:hypothetical protein